MALGKTVFQVLREISSSELTEWAAFYRLEPWGGDKDDFRMGTIASAVYNVNRTKKSQKALRPTDFMQKQPVQEPDQDSLTEKITATFRHVATVFKTKPSKPTEPK